MCLRLKLVGDYFHSKCMLASQRCIASLCICLESKWLYSSRHLPSNWLQRLLSSALLHFLLGCQMLDWSVWFSAQSAPEAVAHQNSTTTLTGWMQMNCDYPPAREHLYVDFPTHFTWNKTTKRWAPRKRGPTPIGRMYLTHPGLCSFCDFWSLTPNFMGF